MYTEEQKNSSKNWWLIGGIIIVVAIVVLLVVQARKANVVDVDNTEGEVALVSVDSIEIELLERFPVEAQVIVHGYLPDSCSSIGSISVDRLIDTFMITLPLEHDADAEACTQVIENFERTIPLNILGLVAGTYTVDANGVTDTFILEIDNTVSTEFDKG